MKTRCHRGLHNTHIVYQMDWPKRMMISVRPMPEAIVALNGQIIAEIEAEMCVDLRTFYRTPFS